MSAATDLHAAIAQRLFGWAWRSCATPCPFGGSGSTMGADHEGWHDAAGRFAFAPPAYTTDPAATAQVWQWLETRRTPLDLIAVVYWHARDIQCAVQCGRLEVAGGGATWPEALCRAALALAEAVEEEP